MLSALLRNKNLALLVTGRLVSNIGDALYSVASLWLVYDLGGSAVYSGIAGFLIYLPELTTVLIGPFVDRFDFLLSGLYLLADKQLFHMPRIGQLNPG